MTTCQQFTPNITNRKARGAALAALGAVRNVRRNVWMVKSQSGRGEYAVTLASDGTFRCECPDAARSRSCKHVVATRLYCAAIDKALECREHGLLEGLIERTRARLVAGVECSYTSDCLLTLLFAAYQQVTDVVGGAA